MNRVGLLEPLGMRSTIIGGSWDAADDEREHISHMIVDQRAIAPGGQRELSRVEYSMFKQELKRWMQAASDGVLSYGPAPARVEKMALVTDVLEIRLPNRRTAGGDLIHTRLYFTEPEEHDDLLLSLMIAWKSPGHFGLVEQDGHAITAQRRFDNWVAERGDGLQH